MSTPPYPLSARARWLARFWPSKAASHDPIAGLIVDQRYRPIPLTGWKLIPPIQAYLAARRQTDSLYFSADARLTVIIPVRDREHHLVRLLPRLRAHLDAQGIRYRILVVEQSPGKLFNKGVLFNAGFRAAADHCDYVCLHDVDALPLEANYLCPSEPLRLVAQLVGSRQGAARDPRYFGGAISLKREHYLEANGFSNEYWAWGKEDDDFLFRLWFSGRVCYFDQRGTFEDLPNPANQQVSFTKLRKPRTLRANRKRRSRLITVSLASAEKYKLSV